MMPASRKAPFLPSRPLLRRHLLAVLAVAVVAACSSDPIDSSSPEADPSSSPATAAESTPALPATHTNPDGTEVTVEDVSRIVVLNGDIAEVVWALDLGDGVVATDSSATYPPEAAARQAIGYQRALSAEGILSQQPTVVIGTTDAGPPAVLEQIAGTGVPVVVLPVAHDLDAPADKIRAVATALGVPGRGEALATTVQEGLDAVAEQAAEVEEHPSMAVLYLRGANTQLLFGRGTGAETIAEAVGAVPAVEADGTVPLTPEALVAAAPDVLVVTTSGLDSVGGIDGLLAIPGVAQTPAGRDRRVFAYDDQMLLGFGPRLHTCLEQLLADLHPEDS